MIPLIAAVIVALAIIGQPFLAARFLRHRTASFPTHPKEDTMSQAVQDAFSAYQAFRDQQQADAVSAAVAAEQANHQAEIDAAKAAGAQAESDEDVALISAASQPAAQPAPEE